MNFRKLLMLKKRVVLLLSICFACCSLHAQVSELNKYIYVLIPEKFDFQSAPNQYNINTLLKLHLQKEGFEAYMSDEDLPIEMSRSKCNYLNVQFKRSGFLNLKTQFSLVDCSKQVLYTSPEGSTKTKDMFLAYRESIQLAFDNFKNVGYKFSGNKSVEVEQTDKTSAVNIEERQLVEKDSSDKELFFFSQPIANGFQVVDSKPQVIMRLFHTTAKNIFIGVKGDTHGVLFQKNGQWFFEFYENGKLISEKINIRF
ncbi:MAG: hypothetical protein CFE24_01285 [Flavobacterium sp. BFFFF2]|nr:MAG: hypothetical protein CFE24_01285 [Flavobacterium sp. BFFFF2]